MSRLRWFLVLTGLLVLVVFSLSNTNAVPVRMPFLLDREVPLAMLLALSAVIGFAVGSLWTAWMLRRRGATPKHKSDRTSAPTEASLVAEKPTKPSPPPQAE
ncbi:MAG: LapA family protein [Planctomycetota bacterium]